MAYLTLPFIQEKIRALQNALFFPLTDSPLKMATSIVHVIHVDDVGQIWFSVTLPPQFIYTFDNSFGAKLDFSKKDKDFFLKIFGKAFIVTDPEEINSIFYLSDEIREKATKNEIVLIKVKISHADYFEKKHHAVESRVSLKKIPTRIYKWMINQRHYKLSASMKFPVSGMISADQVFSN